MLKSILWRGIKVNLVGCLIFIVQIDLAWNVSSGTSGVHDYYIGIATEKTSVPDIVNFESTHGQRRKRLYHPRLFNGEQFYFVLKTVTKSAVTDIKVS